MEKVEWLNQIDYQYEHLRHKLEDTQEYQKNIKL